MNKGVEYLQVFIKPKTRVLIKSLDSNFSSLQCGWTQISVFRIFLRNRGVIKTLRLDSNVSFLNDASLEQHGFSRHIHLSSSYYYVYVLILLCLCPPSRRTYICAMYVSYYYNICPQLIFVCVFYYHLRKTWCGPL